MSEKNVHEIEKFYGCYLLVSLNKDQKYKAGTYIGFTVNPNRRIKQHNAGYDKGGAKRTSGKGPWEMVLIIHGFPNMISALRFEWAWQNPEKSIRLKHLVPAIKKYNFLFKFNVVSEMLRIGPWCRLPLTIRWLKQEYKRDFMINKLPPSHMPIVYGPVTVVDLNKNNKKTAKQDSSDIPSEIVNSQSSKCCYICKKNLNSLPKTLKCIKCHVENHQICLAKHFLQFEPGHLVPLEGDCPKCKQSLLWGDLIRFKIGCYKNLECTILEDDDDDEDEIVNSGSDSD